MEQNADREIVELDTCKLLSDNKFDFPSQSDSTVLDDPHPESKFVLQELGCSH